MRCVGLDAEALSALAGRKNKRQREVRAASTAAARLHRDVVVPALVLAELYRGRGRVALVDACLSRETGLVVRHTDRAIARLVSSVLAAATTVVADLRRLAAPYRT